MRSAEIGHSGRVVEYRRRTLYLRRDCITLGLLLCTEIVNGKTRSLHSLRESKKDQENKCQSKTKRYHSTPPRYRPGFKMVLGKIFNQISKNVSSLGCRATLIPQISSGSPKSCWKGLHY